MLPATQYIILTIGCQDSTVVEELGMLTFVQSDEFFSFTRTHLVYAVIRYVGDFFYKVKIRMRIEIMRIPRLADRYSKRLSSLRNANGSKEMLSQITRCYDAYT